ncbi:outer membrane protein assembly factor BamD [Rivihabitans pingtungensis]|jgi:outer membrane protein assembly factor BamD|uniref:outer membrane protein assembly factor BamD n=1 Tax=Rivihabitans pingtungensis TaxID=1054498 RepID=UPI0023550F50|nr:outer membrane protein assembly factor BamD [Rivihabitans pingtungensis]MCK6435591.1 outer membrane protein assembly factor BamD [Rivihabitans pingtungensis]HNX70788.1 outer membrane protein assembly factor BamD [Rivihabitans pingtungensis]
MKKIVAAMLMTAGLVACSSTKGPADETRGWPIERLYGEARDELNSGNYTRAVQLYETLEARFPYGRYAQQAQMDLAYAHYKDKESQMALAACDRFIKLHPAHANLDYIYYLKGLIHFNEDESLLTRWTGQDLSERDPRAGREAFQAFGELIKRFPDSQYADDARKKMIILVDALAANEMHVARYYMKRKAYLAAANRAQAAIREFSNTPYVEEALALMATAYTELDLKPLADDSRRVLAQNYPNSRYLKTPWVYQDMPWYQFWR